MTKDTSECQAVGFDRPAKVTSRQTGCHPRGPTPATSQGAEWPSATLHYLAPVRGQVGADGPTYGSDTWRLCASAVIHRGTKLVGVWFPFKGEAQPGPQSIPLATPAILAKCDGKGWGRSHPIGGGRLWCRVRWGAKEYQPGQTQLRPKSGPQQTTNTTKYHNLRGVKV